MKNLKDLGLMFEQVYLGVLAIIIYEANIISMSPYSNRRKPPNIRKDKLERGT